MNPLRCLILTITIAFSINYGFLFCICLCLLQDYLQDTEIQLGPLLQGCPFFFTIIPLTNSMESLRYVTWFILYYISPIQFMIYLYTDMNTCDMLINFDQFFSISRFMLWVHCGGLFLKCLNMLWWIVLFRLQVLEEQILIQQLGRTRSALVNLASPLR